MNADERRCEEGVCEDVTPVPVRYWWAKRIGVGLVVWVVVMGAVRWWWGWEADRRLAAEIAKYQAAGEPVFLEDFISEPVPDEENAAKLYLEAVEAMEEFSVEEIDLLYSLQDGGDSEDKNPDKLGILIKRGAPALALARRARELKHFEWETEDTIPGTNIQLPNLIGTREVVKMLYGAASYHHAIGNDREAMEYLHNAMALCAGIDKMPFLISHLVSCANHSLVASLVEEIAHEVKVLRNEPSEIETAMAASPQNVSEVIRILLDNNESRKGLIRAFYAERMANLDRYRHIEDGVLSLNSIRNFGVELLEPNGIERITDYVILPVIQLDLIYMMRYMSACAEAAKANNLPIANSKFPVVVSRGSLVEQMVHPVSTVYISPPNNPMSLHFKTLAARRRAAVALAARLYEVDHGRKPRSVADLVPVYLEAVPLDPMVDDGSVIGLPEAWAAEAEGTTEETPRPKDD